MGEEKREKEMRSIANWRRKLSQLLTEMETFYGDPPAGTNPEKLESLTRFAWEEANDRMRQLERDEAHFCR